MRIIVSTLCTISLTTIGLLAQSPTMSCKDQGWGNQGANKEISFCEIRESTVAALATLNVDGRQNGGISVIGANRSDILVRSMIQTHGVSLDDAKNQAAQVLVHTSAGTVQADGPSGKNWSVSYEILLPQKINLSLKANNGGVNIAGMESSVEFQSVNGGINLKNMGGNVHGDTVNGGVSVNMNSARWNGSGLDISTQNGGVSMKVPERFSAVLDLETVNGGVSVKLPDVRLNRNDHRLNVTLGSGGPLIRIRTHNGGVSVSGAAIS